MILVKKKKKIIVNSLIKRDFLSVKNIAKYISLLALKRENLGIVNLCSGKSISLKSLINILTKEYKIKPIVKYEHIKLRNYESNNFYGNNSKLTEILNS